jgi:alpha-ketoglutarate-dependent taurine dioxygenase
MATKRDADGVAKTVHQNLEVVPAERLSSHHDTGDQATWDKVQEKDKWPVIGAEVRGITDFAALSDANIETIRQALNKHKVVWFSGFSGETEDQKMHFTPWTQLAFAERFGEVKGNISRVPEYVEKGVHQSAHSVRHDKHNRAETQKKDDVPQGAALENKEQVLNTMVEANKEQNRVWAGADGKGEAKVMPQRVARLVREPGDPFAFGEGWHADVTFFEEPPVYTLLTAREMPGGDDDTFYICTERAYATLPEDLKKEITGLHALHDDSAGKQHTHPIVRTHPETGVQALYANSHFAHSVVGYSKAEGKALLDKLFDHIEAQPIFKFKWAGSRIDSLKGFFTEGQAKKGEDGTSSTHPRILHTLMWDNRALQHTATTDWAHNEEFKHRRRELHRVTISGNGKIEGKPFYRPKGL